MQVSGSIAETIKARIVSGEWTVGQRLPSITQLAQDFGVGTGSIREALKALATLGVLRVEHGRGTFVAALPPPQDDPYRHFQDLSVGSILELCEARRILEPELAAFAAERGSAEELQMIRNQALAMERLVAVGADFLQPDLEFHRQIALAAHNAVLARMMDGVNDLLLESRKITMIQPGMDQRAVRYHLLIADAIDDRDPSQARLLMLAHINDAIKSILEWQGHSQKIDYPVEQGSNTNPLVIIQQR
jgi:GntR family transcriptional regulator, transcriptional repressor for pyruvate dehydrogenase complex